MLSPVPLVRDLSMGPASFSRIEATNENLRDIGRTTLESLSQSLHLDPIKNLAAHHRKGQASPTALGLLKYLPYEVQIQGHTIGHVPNTDIGSLSKVFSDVPGLQIYDPRKESWMYIQAREGCMVCNIGDSVEFLSDNVLRLSSRRVTPFPADAGKVKLTVVYFMRRETDAVFFVDREGK